MTNYIELKRLAEHAFNGPWTFTEIDPDDKSWGACELQNKDGAFIATHVCGVFNASYIAAASPDVVLSMIAEIDKLRTQNRALREALEQISKNDLHSDGDIARAALKQAEGGV